MVEFIGGANINKPPGCPCVCACYCGVGGDANGSLNEETVRTADGVFAEPE